MALVAAALAIPSNLVIVGAGMIGVAGGDRELVHTEAEINAYSWIDEHVPAGSLVLASARIGNRLPAFADVRVLYGHPFETPDAVQALDSVETLFRSGSDPTALEKLQGAGVDYVFFGPDERALGDPGWIDRLESVATFAEIEVLRVPER